jgi:hypothetical protein
MVRLTLTSGERENVYDPALAGDSLKGNAGPPEHEACSVSIDDITKVEYHGTDYASTVVLAGLGLLLVVSVATYDLE